MLNLRPLKTVFLMAAAILALSFIFVQAADAGNKDPLKTEMEKIKNHHESLQESIDDILWINKLSDIAYVDKIWQYSSPVKAKGNVLKFHSHVFFPKQRKTEKIPLIVFAHGGMNGAFQTKYAHIIRELISQGYAVIAPEYRGSRGFGANFKKAMDKGGKELDDIHMARNFMLNTFSFIDQQRVGIMGWSFGGFVAAMSPMIHPNDYQVAFSGNPVSNLAFRMSYKNKKYRSVFEKKIIGKTVEQDPEAYINRSPVGHVNKLKIPLLIHTTDSDKVVKVEEVKTLVEALKKAKKDVTFKVYEQAPGDHSFERMHTSLARKARVEVYQFLAKILKPENPFKDSQELVSSWITK